MENKTVTIPKGCLPYLMIDVAGAGLCFAETMEDRGIPLTRMRRTKDGWVKIIGSSVAEPQGQEP